MIDGIVNVYKERGFTSHDVVAKLRGILKVKAGHTGTLDPDAEGVLPICLGKATKLADLIMADIKGYRTIIQLGVTTDTEDSSGEILETRDVLSDQSEIEAAILSFKGEYMQRPPMYSALKVNGQKLYKLARQGQVIERQRRLVHIYEINILNYLSGDKVEIEVLCSKGTYIRTLCSDIGEKLGCGANMHSLLRTRSGDFYLKDSLKLAEIKMAVDNGEEDNYIRPISGCLSGYSRLHVLPEGNNFLYNGNKVSFSFVKEKVKVNDGEEFLVFDEHDKLIGIYGVIAEKGKMLKPITMFQ